MCRRFIRNPEGDLQGVELKVSGVDGVCGLTVSEERLLRAGHIRVLAVNPIKGVIGEFETEALLRVPRRVDGIPVGQALIEWSGERMPGMTHAENHRMTFDGDVRAASVETVLRRLDLTKMTPLDQRAAVHAANRAGDLYPREIRILEREGWLP